MPPSPVSADFPSRSSRGPQRRREGFARANRLPLALVVLAVVLQWAVLPLALHARGASALWLLLPIVLLTPTQWGLIHEAIHGHLTASRRLNDWLGRALALTMAIPFDVVRFGHLMHHRFARERFDRPDVWNGRTPYPLAWLLCQVRLLGGLYLTELLMPLLACIPARSAVRAIEREFQVAPSMSADEARVTEQGRRLFAGFVGDPRNRARLRRHLGLTSALLAALALVYGAWWPALLLGMYLRGVWLSVADNLPHCGVGIDERGRARNFRLPRFCGPWLLNHHLHRAHHLDPSLPWHALPAAACADFEAPAGTPSYFGTALRQFAGPLRWNSRVEK